MRLMHRGLPAFLAAALIVTPFLPSTTVHAASLRMEPASHSPAPAGPLETLVGVLVVGMALRVKDTATTARKWVTRATAAAGDYKTGVQSAAADWEANTLAGKDNYAAGVQQAIGDNRYERGVREAGGAKFASRAAELGATRFAPGVSASEGAFSKGVGPVLQALVSMNLPPRAPKGSPQNMERANYVATQLRKLKTGR